MRQWEIIGVGYLALSNRTVPGLDAPPDQCGRAGTGDCASLGRTRMLLSARGRARSDPQRRRWPGRAIEPARCRTDFRWSVPGRTGQPPGRGPPLRFPGGLRAPDRQAGARAAGIPRRPGHSARTGRQCLDPGRWCGAARGARPPAQDRESHANPRFQCVVRHDP